MVKVHLHLGFLVHSTRSMFIPALGLILASDAYNIVVMSDLPFSLDKQNGHQFHRRPPAELCASYQEIISICSWLN